MERVIFMDALICLKTVSGFAWLFPAAMAVKPTWRLIRRRPHDKDAIWAVALLGILNRWMFTTGWPGREISYTAAILLAFTLGAVMVSYQADDHA